MPVETLEQILKSSKSYVNPRARAKVRQGLKEGGYALLNDTKKPDKSFTVQDLSIGEKVLLQLVVFTRFPLMILPIRLLTAGVTVFEQKTGLFKSMIQ